MPQSFPPAICEKACFPHQTGDFEREKKPRQCLGSKEAREEEGQVQSESPEHSAWQMKCTDSEDCGPGHGVSFVFKPLGLIIGVLFPRRARDSRKRIREESPREESSAGMGCMVHEQGSRDPAEKENNDNYNIVGFHFLIVMYGSERVGL